MILISLRLKGKLSSGRTLGFKGDWYKVNQEFLAEESIPKNLQVIHKNT